MQNPSSYLLMNKKVPKAIPASTKMAAEAPAAATTAEESPEEPKKLLKSTYIFKLW